MKKIFLSLLLIELSLTVSYAQSLEVLQPLQMIENSSVMAQYNNQFAKWNMPDKDIPFPFALIRVLLDGSGTEVRIAKEMLSLDVGTMYAVESTYYNADNEIWFLIPYEIKNIYIKCGDGCERQRIYSNRLRPNTVYFCKVHYEPEESMLGGGKKKTQDITFTVNGVSFDMVYVAGGSFEMGCTPEQGKDADLMMESPVHKVNLSSFHIGKHEVSQALWQAVMGSNPSNHNGDSYPVEQVSWTDCQTFIGKLNQQLESSLGDFQFAMPSEAQWEYAARGGIRSQKNKYAGNSNCDLIGWTNADSDDATHEIGGKLANELGIYDMSGNVWEYCMDSFGIYTSDEQTDPVGTKSSTTHVMRGGSAHDAARFARVSARKAISVQKSDAWSGLRLVLTEKL